MTVRFESTLTCPRCGARHRERMRDDACWFFYTCPACGAALRPKPGDCCVFCSWGDTPCPPCQRAVATAARTATNTLRSALSSSGR